MFPLEPPGSRTKARDDAGGGCLISPPRGPVAALRRHLRRLRRALPRPVQRAHAGALLVTLRRDLRFLKARRLAAYWPSDGEIDPGALLAMALSRGKQVYLPVLRRRFGSSKEPSLWFARFTPGERMRLNRFNIPEPRTRGRRVRGARHLDLLLMPLVGFDSQGHRLGMGGGYYDRTLAYLGRRRLWKRPRLLGLAHECQRVERLEPMPWDVPLDAIATERRLYRTPRH